MNKIVLFFLFSFHISFKSKLILLINLLIAVDEFPVLGDLILYRYVHSPLKSILNFFGFLDDDEVFHLLLRIDDISLLEMGFSHLGFEHFVHAI